MLSHRLYNACHAISRRHGRVEDGWSSTILGFAKRDLAKDVIAVFGKFFNTPLASQ